MDVVEWAKRAVELGASELVLNSIDADGTRDGYDNELNRTVAEAVDVPVIASGGVGNLQHLVDGILIGKADGVLAASIFHFGEYSVSEAKAYTASPRHPCADVGRAVGSPPFSSQPAWRPAVFRPPAKPLLAFGER